MCQAEFRLYSLLDTNDIKSENSGYKKQKSNFWTVMPDFYFCPDTHNTSVHKHLGFCNSKMYVDVLYYKNPYMMQVDHRILLQNGSLYDTIPHVLQLNKMMWSKKINTSYWYISSATAANKVFCCFGYDIMVYLFSM